MFFPSDARCAHQARRPELSVCMETVAQVLPTPYSLKKIEENKDVM